MTGELALRATSLDYGLNQYSGRPAGLRLRDTGPGIWRSRHRRRVGCAAVAVKPTETRYLRN